MKNVGMAAAERFVASMDHVQRVYEAAAKEADTTVAFASISRLDFHQKWCDLVECVYNTGHHCVERAGPGNSDALCFEKQ